MSMSTGYMYVHIFILRICARRRRCLRRFRWYPYFVYSSGAVSGIRGKQMTPAIASERRIFSENHDYNTYIKSFPCRGEHVRIPIFRDIDARSGRKLRTDTHTYTHTRDSHSDNNNQDYSKR